MGRFNCLGAAGAGRPIWRTQQGLETINCHSLPTVRSTIIPSSGDMIDTYRPQTDTGNTHGAIGQLGRGAIGRLAFDLAV